MKKEWNLAREGQKGLQMYEGTKMNLLIKLKAQLNPILSKIER